MAKSKTTVTQSYFHGALTIKSFIKGEIGSEKDARAKQEKLHLEAINRAKANGIITKEVSRQLDDLGENLALATKLRNHYYYNSFKEYGNMLWECVQNDKPENTYAVVDQLLQKSREVRNHQLFSNKKLKWKSAAGIKAVGKFADLLLANDERKFDYYQKCVAQGAGNIKLSDLLIAPTPRKYEATETKIELLADQMKALEEKLTATEGGIHVNSSEYKRMKKAIKALNHGLKNGITQEVLGQRFEELQAASMDYVNAKGVGTQSTQRGIDRMDAALDICSVAVEGMDYFMSNERAEAVKRFENNHFNKAFRYEVKTEYIRPVEDPVYGEPAFEILREEPAMEILPSEDGIEF